MSPRRPPRTAAASWSPAPTLHAEIAALEAWRLITTRSAIAGIAVAEIVTLTVGTLRVLS